MHFPHIFLIELNVLRTNVFIAKVLIKWQTFHFISMSWQLQLRVWLNGVFMGFNMQQMLIIMIQ